jgi:hypothetical protein
MSISTSAPLSPGSEELLRSDYDVLPITVYATPRLTAIGTQTVSQGRRLQFTATAPQQPAGSLVYSLDRGAPAGASIDPLTGTFTWTPALPGVYKVTVRVTVNGVPQQTAAQAVTVVVLPVIKSVVVNRTPTGLVSGLTVFFGSAMNVLPGAFVVTQPGGRVIPLHVTVSPTGTSATISFVGGRAIAVLQPPGRFTLTVFGGLVRDATWGLWLDAAGNQRMGSVGAFTFGPP